MQRKIWEMKWESFTNIQEKSIPAIIQSQSDIIISSPTASGKTEAAFLPILSIVEKDAQKDLKVIYISPLKALINNQFSRIQKLCEHIQIDIHRWHGDINVYQKKKLIRNPSGILQITPESIESLLINRTEHLYNLFSQLSFIVIDEIHSFIGKDRGVHLRSVLSRLAYYTPQRPRIVAISATITNFELVKYWINPFPNQDVCVIEEEHNNKELQYSLMHFQAGKDHKTPLELFEDLRILTTHNKSLIFCNSRSQVEEGTIILNRLAAKEENSGELYYAHHSSIDHKERKYVENILAETNLSKSILSTSSLELGIDIGEIDLVVQIDSTFTVSSLKQRLGRSGRKQDSVQMLQLYTTELDSLIQAIAVMELILDKWIEPAQNYSLPYDILFQQIISLCHQYNGLKLKYLQSYIQKNAIFFMLPLKDIQLLIEFMVEKEYIQVISGEKEYIVGLEGERLIRNKDFYAIFMTPEEYTVIDGVRTIGKLDQNFIININDRIILAGRLWTIIDIDIKTAKVFVQKASDGKPPVYLGKGADFHSKIFEKMLEIICSEQLFDYINDEGKHYLTDIRRKYKLAKVKETERIIWYVNNEFVFETFVGTKIANTLMWMIRLIIGEARMNALSKIIFHGHHNFEELIESLKRSTWKEEELLKVTHDNEWFTSKYMEYLPESLQKKVHIAHKIDIEGAISYLNKFKFRVVKSNR